MAKIEQLEQQIKALEERKKQLLARKQRIEARENEALGKEMRKVDTRRKILLGAMTMEMMDEDESARARILKRLDTFLSRPDDRRLFGLDAKEMTNERESAQL
jgi:hypothetical protein